jgi:hypothetical protein
LVDRNTATKEIGLKGYPVATNTTIHKGVMCNLNSGGYLVEGAEAASHSQVVGVADETVVNSGADGAKMCRVRADRLFDFAASSITQAMVGKRMYLVDNQTFDDTPGANAIVAGTLVEFVSTTRGFIHIPTPGQAGQPATIATGDIEDLAVTAAKIANATITRTQMAAAARGLENVIADPGTGVAIPVTANGSIALTIAATGETNTLAVPGWVGQRLSIIASVLGASDTRIITASQRINQTGNTVMTFAAAEDFIELVGVDIGGALRWQVVANDGVALS